MEHGELVTKGENLSLQGGTGPKTGGEESEKSHQNRVHRGYNHHRTNDRNLCVFKSEGVFGTHRWWLLLFQFQTNRKQLSEFQSHPSLDRKTSRR